MYEKFMCPDLRLRTGLDDDHRRPLTPNHEMYRPALYALQQQHRWTTQQHRDYWAAHLHLWPREPGPRRTRQTAGYIAHALRDQGFTAQEIANGLCVDIDTIRHTDLFAAGEEVHDQQIDGPPRRFAQHGPQPPLPRVYRDGEEEPAFTHVNLPLGSYEHPPHLRQLWLRFRQLVDERPAPTTRELEQWLRDRR